MAIGILEMAANPLRSQSSSRGSRWECGLNQVSIAAVTNLSFQKCYFGVVKVGAEKVYGGTFQATQCAGVRLG